MVENIQRGVPEKIDRLKTQVVLQEILEITDPNIIQTLEAGGIDRQKSFQHLVTVIASILRGGYVVPTTQKEWKNLGYRGEWVFGEKELNAVNAFFAQIKGNPQRENMVQYIAQARNKEDAYRDLLQGIRDKRLANMSQNDTGAIQYTEGKGLESNMDSKVDALIGGETLWSGIVSRDALEVAIKRALTV